MDHSYLISFLDKRSIPIITRKRRTYLAYFGLEQEYTYVLREGVVKTSVILRDGREFNISYIKGPDIISLLRDEVSSYTSAPFNVRVESESASFYRIPRVKFWNYVNGDSALQTYVKEYYRASLAEAIRRRIPYCFAAHKYPGVPALELHEIEAGCAFPVKDTEVLPFRVWHGRLPILGYRIGGLAYITDMTALPDESLAALDGITHLVMNALRIAPHPTHQSLQEALDKVELLRSRTSLRTVYLIHMSHSIGLHREVDAALPPYVRLAYDGLSFSL